MHFYDMEGTLKGKPAKFKSGLVFTLKNKTKNNLTKKSQSFITPSIKTHEGLLHEERL